MLRAARYLGVAPWVLWERSDKLIWQQWALTAEAAEAEARAMQAEQAQKRAARKR